MSSMALPPRQYSTLKLMVDTQLRTKVQPPPPSLSLAGRTAIITGSNTGIGLECAGVMLGYGLSCLIMAVRTVSKGEQAAQSLRERHPQADIQIWELDMLSYHSIQEFASRCAHHGPGIDVAILNASVFQGDFTKCQSTGHEATIQVNYLSTALLALSLLPVLKPTPQRTSPGRLVIVSSSSGLTSQFGAKEASPLLPAFDTVESFKADGTMEKYMMMLGVKLAETVSSDEVIINTVDPGLTAGSELHRDLSAPARAMFGFLKATLARPPEHEAWLYMDAAVVRGKESHGGFIVNWEIYPFHPFLYTHACKRTLTQLWSETKDELAGVIDIDKIVKSLRT